MKISKVIFHIKPIPSHPWWECNSILCCKDTILVIPAWMWGQHKAQEKTMLRRWIADVESTGMRIRAEGDSSDPETRHRQSIEEASSAPSWVQSSHCEKGVTYRAHTTHTIFCYLQMKMTPFYYSSNFSMPCTWRGAKNENYITCKFYSRRYLTDKNNKPP